jgi:TolB-like protein/DNA-binding winged helix-turn-helix (wHTH) protein/Flp pilus assembly protein TadD
VSREPNRTRPQANEVMPQSVDPPRYLKFGIFEADLDARELRKAGKLLPLQEQPFQLLAMLLRRPGEVVTREEMQASLWPQTIVDFDHGLNKAVSKVRDALGDSAENPRFIQTVARRGYRFLADVAVVARARPVESAAPEAVSSDSNDARAVASPKVSWRLAAWALAALAIALSLWVGALRMTSAPKSSAPQVRSLAVLPLENLSGDSSQEYFADGMTDELITQLAQIRALRVISRSSVMSYKHLHRPLTEIARELNVEAVVEGSILRSGDRVRITAQLIRVPADEHIWAQSFEGNLSDTLALQGKVAQAVADRIRVTLSSTENAALQKTQSVNIQAYDDYLKGRYYWNQRTREGLKQAIDYFKSSIASEPKYAEAYAGLADSYALSGDWEYGILAPAQAFAQAKQAAYQALALNDNLSEAHTSLAFVLDLYGWDWEGAEEQYQLAIALSPGYATAHHWYAFHLLLMGHIGAGIDELRIAENLDPLSLIIGADVADALCIAHRFDESVQQSRKTLALGPNFALGHFELGQALVQLRQYDAAIAEFHKAIEIAGHRAVFDSNLAYAYAVSGRTAEAVQIAKDLQLRPDSNLSANENIALIYAGLRDPDQAMIWLNKAYDARFNPSILLRPGFDSLRQDPRFKDLRHRIGLPADM